MRRSRRPGKVHDHDDARAVSEAPSPSDVEHERISRHTARQRGTMTATCVSRIVRLNGSGHCAFALFFAPRRPPPGCRGRRFLRPQWRVRPHLARPVLCSASPEGGVRSLQKGRHAVGIGIIGILLGAGRPGRRLLLGAGSEDWESFVRALICLALLAIVVFSARAAFAASLRTTAASTDAPRDAALPTRSSCATRGRAAARSRSSDWWIWQLRSEFRP